MSLFTVRLQTVVAFASLSFIFWDERSVHSDQNPSRTVHVGCISSGHLRSFLRLSHRGFLVPEQSYKKFVRFSLSSFDTAAGTWVLGGSTVFRCMALTLLKLAWQHF